MFQLHDVVNRVPSSCKLDPHYNPFMTLDVLARAVADCFACARMDHVHVLSQANGHASARVMFIGEAPGRLGAARTRVPFTQDQSGKRFEMLLAAAGLHRDEVFVTNALLCNPLGEGLNRPPSVVELRACSGWLTAQVVAVDPAVIVTLGTVALKALYLIDPHPFVLRSNVSQRVSWNGRILVPLYHPSPRTAAHRSFQQQLADFAALASLPANSARR